MSGPIPDNPIWAAMQRMTIMGDGGGTHFMTDRIHRTGLAVVAMAEMIRRLNDNDPTWNDDIDTILKFLDGHILP